MIGSRKADSNSHPLIYRYLKKYQEDPTSRVFAPLAEAYRKAGLTQEAVEIAREGLRLHPGFVGGRVALARALFDQQLYQEVLEELTAVVRDVPDNLVAQKLLAESCLMIGRVTEALSAYKMLLYFNPQDAESARIVLELEAKAYEKGTLVLRSDPPQKLPEFEVRPVHSVIEQDPGRKRLLWIKKIERLQILLQKVERYKATPLGQSQIS